MWSFSLPLLAFFTIFCCLIPARVALCAFLENSHSLTVDREIAFGMAAITILAHMGALKQSKYSKNDPATDGPF
jgi:hypothetical protein